MLEPLSAGLCNAVRTPFKQLPGMLACCKVGSLFYQKPLYVESSWWTSNCTDKGRAARCRAASAGAAFRTARARAYAARRCPQARHPGWRSWRSLHVLLVTDVQPADKGSVCAGGAQQILLQGSGLSEASPFTFASVVLLAAGRKGPRQGEPRPWQLVHTFMLDTSDIALVNKQSA